MISGSSASALDCGVTYTVNIDHDTVPAVVDDFHGIFFQFCHIIGNITCVQSRFALDFFCTFCCRHVCFDTIFDFVKYAISTDQLIILYDVDTARRRFVEELAPTSGV